MSTAKIDKLKLQFNAQKTVLNNLLDKTVSTGDESEEDKTKIAASLEIIKRKMTTLMTVAEQIQNLITDENELTDFMLETTDFEVFCQTKIGNIERFMKTEEKVVVDTTTKARVVKLPRLVIETFDGDYKEWQTFYDSYEAAVHSQPSLSQVEKFNYLRSYLHGDARRVIEGLQLTNENYEKALGLLKERYGNKQAIITAHMNELLILRRIDNEDDAKEIRHLYDKISTHIRSLQSLGVEGDNYGALLVPIILERLPKEFKRHISRAKGVSDCWDLTNLLNLINEEVKVMETSTPGNIDYFSISDSSRSTGTILYAGNKSMKPNKISCVFCEGPHWSDKCSVVSDRQSRKEFLRKNRCCFLCLRKGHQVSECKKSKPCYYCKGLHNSSICTRDLQESALTSTSQVQSLGTHSLASDYATKDLPKGNLPKGDLPEGDLPTQVNITQGDVLLQTADVVLKNKHSKRELKVKVLFDSGSQRTYISEKACKFLDLHTERTEQLKITTFGSKRSIPSNGNLVNVTAITLDHKEIEFLALCFSHLCVSLPCHSVETAKLGFDSIPFADKGNIEGDVDLLIGSDLLWHFFTGKIIRSKTSHGLVAMETVFGWVLDGPSKADPVKFPTPSTTQINTSIVTESNTLDDQVKKFWDLETIGIRDEKPFVEIFSESIERDDENRYQVHLPFKDNHPIVSDNYELSKQRLLRLHSKLREKPELLKQYDDIIQEQLRSGIIEPATQPGDLGETSYLPHHAVIRDDKETTKVRIVYDASAKGKGPSLNDCLLKGPQLTPLLFDILLRFRSQIIALSADIEKAFLQIGVVEQDRDYLRFLWFDNVFSDQPTIVRNRFARVTFGVTSSPFCLNATVRKHAESYEFDPEFIDAVLSSFFVDDFVGGETDETKAFELFKKLQLRFLDGHFWLRKWRTSNAKLRERIDAVSDCKSSHERILGIIWDDMKDVFVFDFQELYETAKDLPPTKRNVLKIIASFYDPLGLLQPIISSMKILLQQIHKDNVLWDQELSGHLRDTWFCLLEQLHSIGKVEIDRCVESVTPGDEVISREIHGFSDASKQGYGACVYIRSIRKSGSIKVSLLTAKSRVSPLKEETIPRLELLGNLLLARLISSVKHAYHLPFHKTFLWTDSKVTLAWIRSDREYKTFVQNRLNEIRRLTKPNDWFYCPTKDNPADVITRSELSDPLNPLWWEGPAFLQSADIELAQQLDTNDTDSLPELKAPTAVNASATKPDHSANNIFDFQRYSSYKKLIRTTAWVLRFIQNAKAKAKKQSRNFDTILRSNELQHAEKVLVKANQHDLNGLSERELIENFKHLNVKTDNEGIYRCYGRLENAPLPQETKNPILLNSKHLLTGLIVNHFHRIRKHILVKQTLTELRTKFWICKGRSYVRSIISKCVTCRKLHAKHYRYPPNPPLPALRLSDVRPFYATGVDNFGPVYLKTIYGRDPGYKAWVTLYTCASSRAILLDLVPQIDSQCFIRSLNRLIARRGCPDHMISDNGTNFVSVESQTHAANLGIDWHCNIPLAPWHGGFFERLVRSVKELLRKELENRRLNYEQLQTVLFEIEAILNNRPLTYVYPNDLQECITPNHLLYGRQLNFESTNGTKPYDSQETASHDTVVEVIDRFWSRWLKEYVINLRETHKHYQQNRMQPTAEIGDVVLIHDENLPRSRWRMGIVTEIIRGADNRIRGAVVRSSTKALLKRPVNKLFPIEYVRPEDNVHEANELKKHKADNVPAEHPITVLKRPRRQAAVLGDIRRKYTD